MADKIRDLILSCFPRQLNRQIKELYLSSIILVFAESMVIIFEPVFLYTIFFKSHGFKGSLQLLLCFYLVIYLLYFAVLPLGARFAKRFGYESSIALGVFFTALLYGSLFMISKFFWPFTVLTIIFYVLAKMFYWPAYHANFARFSASGQRGRQISNLAILETIVCIVGPLLGGLILKFFGFEFLFIIACALIIISNIPLLITREQFEPKPFEYFKVYKDLFSRERRKKFFSLWGYGEEFITMVVWPVFIFTVVKDFLGLGALTAFSLFLTTIVFLFIGRITDRQEGRLVMRYGTIFYSFSWLLRLISRGVLGVFLIDSYSRLAKQSISVPTVALTYSKATRKDSSVMGTIVFFEMSLVVGKIVTMLAALVLLQIFTPGWNSMFILAGLMTLLYLLF
ncbi:MAG: MFS transporter [Patescibacteria group bacterium]